MDWYGNETLHNTPFTNMTINGKAVAAIQNVDNFTFAYVPPITLSLLSQRLMLLHHRRVFQAGHEVVSVELL